MNTLDSNRLLNLKQRQGLAIASGKSTSIYLKSKKCERKLKDKLKGMFKYQVDLDIEVSRVVDKINEVSVYKALIEYIDTVSSEQLFEEIKKIKIFLSKIKKMIVEECSEDEEDLDTINDDKLTLF